MLSFRIFLFVFALIVSPPFLFAETQPPKDYPQEGIQEEAPIKAVVTATGREMPIEKARGSLPSSPARTLKKAAPFLFWICCVRFPV